MTQQEYAGSLTRWSCLSCPAGARACGRDIRSTRRRGHWDEFVRTGDWDTGTRPPMALVSKRPV